MIFFAILFTLLQGELVRSRDPEISEKGRGTTPRVTEMKCMEYSKPIIIHNTDLFLDPYPKELLSQEIAFIAGGIKAYPREFPHMVAIGWLNSDGSHAFDCGGTLISPSFVLTAAHCSYAYGAENPAPQVVQLGDRNINSSVNDAVQVEIKTIHKHPAYTDKKYYNDIALLELSRAVTYTENIRPICIWTKELDEYKSAIATGWGVTNPYTNEKAEYLQEVTLSILRNEICLSLLKDSMNRKWNQGIISSQLCAGEPEGGKDTCPGDSGSPLQIISQEYPHNYYLIGITSFGPRFCAQHPAIYTKVSSYLDWIESTVWPEEYRNWTIINKINQ